MTDQARIAEAIKSLYVVIGNTETTMQQADSELLQERLRTLNGVVARLECIREDMRAE